MNNYSITRFFFFIFLVWVLLIDQGRDGARGGGGGSLLGIRKCMWNQQQCPLYSIKINHFHFLLLRKRILFQCYIISILLRILLALMQASSRPYSLNICCSFYIIAFLKIVEDCVNENDENSDWRWIMCLSASGNGGRWILMILEHFACLFPKFQCFHERINK